jgi:hypothetical protein
MKRFLRRLSQNVYLYNLTYTYLEMHRQMALKRLILRALHRHINKKRTLFLLARQFRPMHSLYSKQATMQQWKRAYHKT